MVVKVKVRIIKIERIPGLVSRSFSHVCWDEGLISDETSIIWLHRRENHYKLGLGPH